MADTKKSTDGPSPYDPDAWDPESLPDYDNDFVTAEDVQAFAEALAAPDISPSEEDLLNPTKAPTEFITALNDWKPIRQRVKGSKGKKGKSKKPPRRGKDETREGWTYMVFKWPLLIMVTAWLIGLGITYLLTRVYIWLYEQYITWRGTRQRIRKRMRDQTSYHDWVQAAKDLDRHLGSDKWKEQDDYAYYNSKTIRRVTEQLRKTRSRVEALSRRLDDQSSRTDAAHAVDDLRTVVEACVKNNFGGYENPRLYSETYYGTKNLVQSFVDEAALAVEALFQSSLLTLEDKRVLAKHLSTNFGRTALCLSGGATFAYYHFGLAKALLDADLMPSIITGTSGGALVAALLATRTNEELKKLLIPALAARITACHDSFSVWAKRWYNTGARFDSVDWAGRSAWFCRGSLTFAEAYERTGRVLNVSCVPSDPHSPTILANYLTAPDCVIWSAVLASAAVPGILNPVVLMRKRKDGKLEPFSFGHKWKDGSLRTDIPLKSLNLHFNVNFSIVSQVNPHVNIFFFSSRGSVGRPVTHRRGRGWRGGFLGSAVEQYVKLDLTKWLKVLRHLELLPRWMGQDWSEVWLQRFSGTITIWPKTILSDFYYILSDPTMERLARMIHVGQQAAFPKLNFIGNRMKIEKIIERARRETRINPNALPTPALPADGQIRNVFSEEDLRNLLKRAQGNNGVVEAPVARYGANDTRVRAPPVSTSVSATPGRVSRRTSDEYAIISPSSPVRRRQFAQGSASSRQNATPTLNHHRTTSLSKRLTGWFGSIGSPKPRAQRNVASETLEDSGGSETDDSYYDDDAVLRASVDTVRPPAFRDPHGSGHGPSASSSGNLPPARRTSVIGELGRQSRVFFDDSETDGETDGETEDEKRSAGSTAGSTPGGDVESADEYHSGSEDAAGMEEYDEARGFGGGI